MRKSAVENPPSTRPNGHALEELSRRSNEHVENKAQPRTHESAAAALPKTFLTKTETAAPSVTGTTTDTTQKRAWWKNLISKPIRMPKFMMDGIVHDYHKAFPEVFGNHPIRPNITYEHSLYYPPFAVIDVKVPNDSFSRKYSLFNEFITQEVSELAADKRTFFGPVLGLATRVMGATSYRLLYAPSFSRWKNVERRLDQVYGKQERKRLIHRAYFLEGDELKNLEEKARDAGCPLDEAYRPIQESKGSIADDSFWQKIPGKWKDVVARIATAAVAYVGKVTDVNLLTLVAFADLSALYTGFMILSHNLPLLSTITTLSFPTFLGVQLALMGVSSVGVMYHEMGHQMTKTLLDLNRKSLASQ